MFPLHLPFVKTSMSMEDPHRSTQKIHQQKGPFSSQPCQNQSVQEGKCVLEIIQPKKKKKQGGFQGP